MGIVIISNGSRSVIGGADWLRAISGGALVAGATTLILDAFSDTNSVLLTAHTISPTNTPATSWTTTGYGYDIQSNQANSKTLNNTASLAWCNAGQADVTVSADITWDTPIGNQQEGLLLRGTDANNNWWVRYVPAAGSGYWDIVEVNAGTATVRATTTQAVNATDAVKAVCSGSTITVFFNGTQIMQYGSATFNQTATLHGLHSYGALLQATRWDNFKVTAP